MLYCYREIICSSVYLDIHKYTDPSVKFFSLHIPAYQEAGVKGQPWVNPDYLPHGQESDRVSMEVPAFELLNLWAVIHNLNLWATAAPVQSSASQYYTATVKRLTYTFYLFVVASNAVEHPQNGYHLSYSSYKQSLPYHPAFFLSLKFPLFHRSL